VARIDAVVVQRQRGIATTREAREIQGAVDSFLQATYLDPCEDRAILVHGEVVVLTVESE